MNHFANHYKFKVKHNAKEPAVKWSQLDNQSKDNINIEFYNIGIPTGERNNLLGLDIDVKDGGVEEFQKYLAECGEPLTLKQSTPSGGYHYFFNYNSAEKDNNYLIANYLTNSTKYRNKGIDIRTNGGYLVGPTSSINGKSYQIVNGLPITDMPTTLINWLLVGSKFDKKKITIKPLSSLKINTVITDIEIKFLLTKLDASYCNKTKKWLKITTVLKTLNKLEIWDEWSQNSEKYEKASNMSIWQTNLANIDINYLYWLLGMEQLPKFKIYAPISDPALLTTITTDSKYINIEPEQMMSNDTICLKSCTGTGKTTATAKAFKQYNSTQRKAKKILSIVSKKSLASQHIKSFGDEGIQLTSYLDEDKKITKDNITVCINSIMLLKDLTISELSNYIVYIDEVTSFLKDVTHNETLRGKQRICYTILMKIIKHCHKLVVSDALISDNVFNFIRTRSNMKPSKLYIENSFKKYANVKAIRIRDENMYLEQMMDNVKQGRYFLSASDSCKTITKFYHKCLEEARPEDVDKFILITSKNQFQITDASEQFRNKFVFYSPSIIFGVDFSIDDKTDVFIYNKGRTLDPSAVFQQTTRTRNIDNLYYYSELRNVEPKFETIDNCKQHYKNLTTTSTSIHEVCVNYDEDDEAILVENTFFELFCYNAYVADIYNTNKTLHYQEILTNAGFELSTIGEVKKLNKDTSAELDLIIKNIDEEIFNNFVETGTTTSTNLLANIELLKLSNVETDVIVEYKDILMKTPALDTYLNVIKICKDEQFILNKVYEIERDNFSVGNINSSYHKVKIVMDLEKKMNIQRLDVGVNAKNVNFFDIPNNEYDLIKKVFKAGRVKPTNAYELIKLYVSMLKNITCPDFILTTRGTKTNDRTIKYKLNTDLVKKYIELNKYSNTFLSNFDDAVLTKLNIVKPIKPERDDKDDDPFLEDHLDKGIEV